MAFESIVLFLNFWPRVKVFNCNSSFDRRQSITYTAAQCNQDKTFALKGAKKRNSTSTIWHYANASCLVHEGRLTHLWNQTSSGTKKAFQTYNRKPVPAAKRSGGHKSARGGCWSRPQAGSGGGKRSEWARIGIWDLKILEKKDFRTSRTSIVKTFALSGVATNLWTIKNEMNCEIYFKHRLCRILTLQAATRIGGPTFSPRHPSFP